MLLFFDRKNLITLLSLVYGCVCFWLEMKIDGDSSFEFIWIEDMVECCTLCGFLVWLKSRVEICEIWLAYEPKWVKNWIPAAGQRLRPQHKLRNNNPSFCHCVLSCGWSRAPSRTYFFFRAWMFGCLCWLTAHFTLYFYNGSSISIYNILFREVLYGSLVLMHTTRHTSPNIYTFAFTIISIIFFKIIQ